MHLVDAIFALIFWCCTAGVAFAYAGYPALIYVLSRAFGSTPIPPPAEPGDLPRAALLIVAHNEAAVIGERLRNALGQDYPADRLDIVVASDGSTDGTVRVCQSLGRRVRTLAFPRRRGKAATLNDAMARIDAEVVILSDANTMMEPGALRALARWFRDPSVGAVCGRLILTDSKTGRNADGAYWRYETFLKGCEATLGALLGANGAIYAVRRSAFVALPAGTLIDDFHVPLAAKLRTGCRIVYDQEAVAREETAPDLRAEFGRRARIGMGAFQSLATLWPLLHPRHGWTALALWSHKIMRWASPLFLIGSFLAALALIHLTFYTVALGVQIAFYSSCAALAVAPLRGQSARLLRLPPMFAAINLALLTGFVRWLVARPTGVWVRTARLDSPLTSGGSPRPG